MATTAPLTLDAAKARNVRLDVLGEGLPLVVTFAFVDWAGQPQFEFPGRLSKLQGLTGIRFNRLMLRDPGNHWYQRGVPGFAEDVATTTQRLAEIIAALRPSRVTMVGQSMGAYAALQFGAALAVDQVLAFGPLSFLDSRRAEAIGDRRWLPVMQALEQDPPPHACLDLADHCRSHCRELHADIHYGLGPEADGSLIQDEYHARRIGEGLPNARLHPWPRSGHAVVHHLQLQRRLDRLLLKTIFPLANPSD